MLFDLIHFNPSHPFDALPVRLQDVLVFESENHGNVLVLDGAIQCVENDEVGHKSGYTVRIR